MLMISHTHLIFAAACNTYLPNIIPNGRKLPYSEATMT